MSANEYAPELATAARVKELAMGLWVSAMMTAVRLRVPDEIGDKPVPAEELASAWKSTPGRSPDCCTRTT